MSILEHKLNRWVFPNHTVGLECMSYLIHLTSPQNFIVGDSTTISPSALFLTF